MRLAFLTSLLFFLTLSFQGKAQDRVNYPDDLEQRQDGRYYLKATGELYAGEAYGRSSNTDEPMIILFEEGLQHGLYRGFFDEERTHLKWQVPYVNGVRQGEYRAWHENGAVSFVVFVKKGDLSGKRYCYREDSTLFHIHHYRRDKEVRKRETYAEDGRLVRLIPFRRGKEHGIGRSFNEEGKLSFKTRYVWGKGRVWSQRFYKSGNLEEEGSFLNGRREGVWMNYHNKKKRTVRAVCTYRNDFKEGEYIQYTTDGKLKKIAYYTKGRLHGPFREYSDSGDILYREGYYEDNKRHGVWREYNQRDGSLQTERVYRNGEVIRHIFPEVTR